MAKKKVDIPLTKEQEEILREKFSEGFEKSFKRGVAEGAYAVYSLVHHYASDTSMTAEERLNKLIELKDTFFSSEQGKLMYEKHLKREVKNGKQG